MHRGQKPHKHTKPTTLHTKQTKHTHTHTLHQQQHRTHRALTWLAWLCTCDPFPQHPATPLSPIVLDPPGELEVCERKNEFHLAPKECYQQAELLLPKNAINKLSSYSQTNSLANQYSLYTMKSMLKLIYRAPIQVYNNTVWRKVIILGTRLVAQSIMVLNTQQESLLRHPA